MPAMFFLAGLFVWPSLQRNGGKHYFVNRLKRLGLPFALSFLIAPLVFFPAYALRTPNSSLSGYTAKWLSLGFWPCGSAWFMAVLLSFDFLIAAASYLKKLHELVERLALYTLNHTELSVCYFFVASALAYIPLAVVYGEAGWSLLGPVQWQTSRGMLYFSFYFAGICFGGKTLQVATFQNDGPIARYWLEWVTAAALNWIASSLFRNTSLLLVWYLLFVTSSVIYTFAFLSVFMRFLTENSAVLDSLSKNAFGIYLVHYVYSSWIQYLALPFHMLPSIKGLLVFFSVLGLSWTTASVLKSHSFMKHIL